MCVRLFYLIIYAFALWRLPFYLIIYKPSRYGVCLFYLIIYMPSRYGVCLFYLFTFLLFYL